MTSDMAKEYIRGTCMTEAQLLAQIRLSLGARPNVRLFRNAAGLAYGPTGIPFRFGLTPGASDLIGWRRITITPEMLNATIAQFLAIEVKSPKGRATPEQENFLRVALDSGAAGGIVRSVEEAAALVEAPLPGEPQ